MDIIKFEIEERLWPNGESFKAVKYIVNQKNLFSILGIGWGVCGLPPDAVYLPSRHLLDEPGSWWIDEEAKKVFITMDSQTGYPDMDSVVVKIELNNDIVVWKDFQLQYPDEYPWLSSNLKNPIFQFERKQYEQALKR